MSRIPRRYINIENLTEDLEIVVKLARESLGSRSPEDADDARKLVNEFHEAMTIILEED